MKRRLMTLFLFPLMVAAQTKPVRNTAVSNRVYKTTINNPAFNWTPHQAEHFTIFTEPGSWPAQHTDSLLIYMEAARKRVFNFLGREEPGTRDTIFFVDSLQKIKSLLGMSVQGFTIADQHLIFFLVNEVYTAKIDHEFCHLFSFACWGAPEDGWINEGLAVSFDSTWNGYAIDNLCKHLKENRRLIPLTRLTRNFFASPGMIAYPEIGSFTKYLHRTYGISRLQQLWISGASAIKKIYGRSLASLEGEWLESLQSIDATGIRYSEYLE